MVEASEAHHSTTESEWKNPSISSSSFCIVKPGCGMPWRFAIFSTSFSVTCFFFFASRRSSSKVRSHASGTFSFIDGSVFAAASIAPTSSRIDASPSYPRLFSTPKKQSLPFIRSPTAGAHRRLSATAMRSLRSCSVPSPTWSFRVPARMTGAPSAKA